jgi:alanine dehydrogenase
MVRRKAWEADLVIGAVLITGAKAPNLLRRADLTDMKSGAVIVDVCIDQGGCLESSRPTTHSDPTYVIDGVVHYCVTNMPGAVGRTSTYALTNATLEYVRMLAERGTKDAVRDIPALRYGLNVHAGQVTHAGVAEAFGVDYVDPETAIAR